MDSRPDDAANAALSANVRKPVTFCFLDLADGPIRVTNAPYSYSFTGTGDEDLDGFTFTAVDPRVVSVGTVKAREGGTDTLSLQLSGLAGVDDELMTQIGDRANYVGRDCRLWRAMLDPQKLTRIGAIWSFYTGYMSVPKIVGDRTSQTINLDVESYLAFFGQASNRTYLDQQSYDPEDRSAELAIAIANGASRRT